MVVTYFFSEIHMALHLAGVCVCLLRIKSWLYLEQLLGRASAVHIHLQTAVEEVSEHRRQPLRVLQLWSTIGSYQVQCLEVGQTVK